MSIQLRVDVEVESVGSRPSGCKHTKLEQGLQVRMRTKPFLSGKQQIPQIWLFELLPRNTTFNTGTATLHLLQHHRMTTTAHNAQNITTTTQHQARHLTSTLQRQQSPPFDTSTCVQQSVPFVALLKSYMLLGQATLLFNIVQRLHSVTGSAKAVRIV